MGLYVDTTAYFFSYFCFFYVLFCSLSRKYCCWILLHDTTAYAVTILSALLSLCTNICLFVVRKSKLFVLLTWASWPETRFPAKTYLTRNGFCSASVTFCWLCESQQTFLLQYLHNGLWVPTSNSVKTSMVETLRTSHCKNIVVKKHSQ